MSAVSAAFDENSPEMRHIIENSLAAYTRAIDDQDPDAAAKLLTGADLYFKDNSPLRGLDAIHGFYSSVFPNSSSTQHVITNLATRTGRNTTDYTAIYQRWSVSDPSAPICEAFGRYSGRFTFSEAGRTWTEHRVLTI